MTSNQQRLEELRQQAKNLAQQIEQLEDQINNTAPTTGLLGRWAKHPQHGNVLVCDDQADDNGLISIRFLKPSGMMGDIVHIDDLAFPDQTTRPQDVPVGEAWLVGADSGRDQTQQTKALKVSDAWWITPDEQPGEESQWLNSEVTLITPLIPARPQDKPETATTEDDYEALPEGTIVAMRIGDPWIRDGGVWTQGNESVTTAQLSGITRHVLRRGWGTSPANP